MVRWSLLMALSAKSGCTIENLLPLAWNIVRMCPRLRLAGLMTIGEYGDDTCFDRLAACRSEVANSLGMAEDELHLSMGMSDDFETAVRVRPQFIVQRRA